MHQGLVASVLGMKVSPFFASAAPQQFGPLAFAIAPNTGVVLEPTQTGLIYVKLEKSSDSLGTMPFVRRSIPRT